MTLLGKLEWARFALAPAHGPGSRFRPMLAGSLALLTETCLGFGTSQFLFAASGELMLAARNIRRYGLSAALGPLDRKEAIR